MRWEHHSGGVSVSTATTTYTAKKLIITAGAWARKVAPQLAQKLTITRQPLAWVQPKNWEAFDMKRFPCWLIRNNGRDFYGFPIVPAGQFGGPLGLKLGLHHPGGETTDPDTVDRTPHVEDEKALIEFLNEFLPEGYQSTLSMKVCMYTKTPDEHFVVDYLPEYGNDVVIATGFSGHGFKFVSVIGEVLADMASTGGSSFDLDFLSLRRFS